MAKQLERAQVANDESRELVLECLTPALVEHFLGDLQEMDQFTMAEPWSRAEWLLELPEKWQLSRIVHGQGIARGFLVASWKGESLHLHRLAVSRSHRRRGLMQRMVIEATRQALTKGCRDVTAKVHPDNQASLLFLNRLGFSVIDSAGPRLILRADPAVVCTSAKRTLSSPLRSGTPHV